MRYSAFYVIKPRQAFLDKLHTLDPPLAEILSETTMLRHQEGGKTLWRSEDWTLQVKLLHVAGLLEYDRLATPETLFAFLEADAVSVEVFDRWWTIERHDVEGDSEDNEPFLATLPWHATGNDYVDSWLEGLAKPTP